MGGEMAEIIEFPTDWTVVEREIRSIIDRSQLNKAAADWIYADLKPRLIELFQNTRGITISGPGAPDDLDEKISSAIAANMLQAVCQIIALEVQLYTALYGNPY
jgi:hypothetical protein